MKATEYHAQGWNCAEAVIQGYNDEHGTDFPVALGSGFGAGAFSGSLCGAVAAAAMVLSLQHGRSRLDAENGARSRVQNLVKAVREKYGSELCRDLKKDRVACTEIVAFAAAKLEEFAK